jgi:very-short-patch-repair endonuclease
MTSGICSRRPPPPCGEGLGVGVAARTMANERARQLRRNRTSAERRLWRELRQLKQIGCKFRQQVPIDHFIVDFACLSRRLIVEVDGGTHSTDREVARDARRERYLKAQGFQVVRVWNSDVRENISGVMDTIVAVLDTPTPDPSPQGGGGTQRHSRRELQ